MEQFDSSVEESSKVSEQQQRNDEQQCPSCAAELTEASVWMIAASETDYSFTRHQLVMHQTTSPTCSHRSDMPSRSSLLASSSGNLDRSFSVEALHSWNRLPTKNKIHALVDNNIQASSKTFLFDSAYTCQ